MVETFNCHFNLEEPVAKEAALNIIQCYTMATSIFNDVKPSILYLAEVVCIRKTSKTNKVRLKPRGWNLVAKPRKFLELQATLQFRRRQLWWRHWKWTQHGKGWETFCTTLHFHRGEYYMWQSMNDIRATSNKVGNRDFYVSMTCIPAWLKISREIFLN